MSRETVHEALDQWVLEEIEAARAAGRSEGKAEVNAQLTALMKQQKADLIDQGREQGRAEAEPLIAQSREQGRLQGVEDGRAMAELAADKKATDEAFKQGKAEGDREGFKRGRGEGYRAGWNDAIDTPVRDHKAK